MNPTIRMAKSFKNKTTTTKNLTTPTLTGRGTTTLIHCSRAAK